MNIPLKFERPVINLLRNAPRTLARVSQTVKDDPYSNFALKQKAETIHNILGLKLPKAKQLLRNARALVQKPLAHYTKIYEILEPFTPIFGQTEESTSLLLSSPPVIQRNCQFLHECGAIKPTADVIAGCQNFMAVSIGIFKSYLHIDSNIDVQERWLSLLPETFQLEAKKHLEQQTTIYSSISHVRNVIFSSYVSQKWRVPYKEIFEWVEVGIKNLPFSIHRLIRVIDVLANTGFDQKKLRKTPALLQSDPASVELFTRTYKEDFLGQRAAQFLLDNPTVTSEMDFANLHTNVDNLRKFGVPAVCIRTNLTDLINQDCVILKEKLRQMEPYPELSVFVHHPKFSKLFADVDTVVLRVETYRAIDKRQITFTACTCPAKEFSAIIQQRAQLRVSDEALNYLSNHTGQPKSKVKEVMRSHPQSRQLGTENMKQVIELLASKGFTKEQIYNGIHLVLYPVALVADKLNELPTRPDMQPIKESMKELNILQIVLYMLEEQFMFTGNGVFAKPPEKLSQNSIELPPQT